MSRLWLGCLVLLFSCEEVPRTPGAKTLGAAEAALPAPVTRAGRFNLPALDFDPTLEVGSTPGRTSFPPKLKVAGVVTPALFPGLPPKAYRVSPGRWLLEDTYNANQLWLWESDAGRLTDLGRGVTMPAPGLGRFIMMVTDSPARALYEIDPDRAALRLVVRAPAAAQSYLSIVGHLDDGAVVLAGLSASQRLSVLRPGGEPRELPIELGRFQIAGPDAIRGKRLLVLGPREPLDVIAQDEWGKPFSAEIAVVDLDSGKTRSIGRARGCWTQTTAVPHPVIGAFWAGSPQPAPLRLGQGDDCHTAVDEVTEQTHVVP